MEPSADELAKALIDNTLIGYAQEYIVVDGRPFSFDRHAYLIDPYGDEHPYQVIEKAAQMGASVLGMLKSFYVCDRLGLNTIYFFPTDADVSEFSKARVAPIIRDSPHLREMVKGDVESVGLRQIGRGFLYFRGMRSNISLKSVPGDMLVFDELDEVTEAQKELADKRLLHSKLKWRYLLSTPTFDGYGIDLEFQQSDKRYWNLICKKCDTRNICEFQFPDIIVRTGETKAHLACRECTSPLDTQYGVWVAERKTERIRGYHLCGLYGGEADLSEMLYKWESGRGREEFMRSNMGIPWVSADMRITRDMVESCIGQHEMGHVQGTRCYMGVDQNGSELHLVIRQRDKITQRPIVRCIAKVSQFGQLDQYMREYDVDVCVIDGTPNQHSARDFARRFPGKVYLNYYNENQKGSYKWDRPGDDTKDEYKNWSVSVNRTEALDAMYEEVTRRDLILPKMGDTVRREFVEQMMGMAKVHEVDEDTGTKKALWKKLGADHFAHASSYSAIAMSQSGMGPGTNAITVGSVLSARVLNYRKYD
jgi:hypothetical protein